MTVMFDQLNVLNESKTKESIIVISVDVGEINDILPVIIYATSSKPINLSHICNNHVD
jgi:dimeric dUTPase (all-alpha-NTP-PPase superfamily)